MGRRSSRKNDTAANMMAMPSPTNASLRTPPPPSEKMMVTPAITIAMAPPPLIGRAGELARQVGWSEGVARARAALRQVG